MAVLKKTLRTCKKGHQYYKSSDCPTCPVCEEQKKPQEGFLSSLSAPARRALESKGITTVAQLATFSAKEVISLHGVGKTTLPKLEAALAEKGMRFKKDH